MNEDEAFIRAIVDSPGDDTPRLVYADWLDDRDDPRGPYLRAEFEWAKPWRSGARPPYDPIIHVAAHELDRVWMLRVSRPPLGVCCEHLRFEESGPRIRASDLDEVTRWPGVQLPSDYAAFLLNYNGGVPRLLRSSTLCVNFRHLTVSKFFTFHPNGDLRDPGTLHREAHRYWNKRLPGFLGERPQNNEQDDDPEENYRTEWYCGFIPIAECGSDNDWLLLGAGGDARELLVSIDWQLSTDSSLYFDFNPPCGSTAALLASLHGSDELEMS